MTIDRKRPLTTVISFPLPHRPRQCSPWTPILALRHLAHHRSVLPFPCQRMRIRTKERGMRLHTFIDTAIRLFSCVSTGISTYLLAGHQASVSPRPPINPSLYALLSAGSNDTVPSNAFLCFTRDSHCQARIAQSRSRHPGRPGAYRIGEGPKRGKEELRFDKRSLPVFAVAFVVKMGSTTAVTVVLSPSL
jgi:hypothetical protein